MITTRTPVTPAEAIAAGITEQAEAEERHDQEEQHRKEIVRNRSNHNRNIRSDDAPASPTAPRQQEQAAAEPAAAPEQMPLF